MAGQTEYKWYSHGLDHEQAAKLQKRYAKIENPKFGLTDRGLALQLELRYEDFGVSGCNIEDITDMKQLFFRTNTSETSELEGKVVETFCEGNFLKGLSVNERLV